MAPDCMPETPPEPDDRRDATVEPHARDASLGADPVRARRALVAKWTLLANRVGYLFVAVAMAVFFIAFAVGFNATLAGVVITTLAIGFALLAPSIVLGYAVKAAEREDRERGF